MEDSVQDIGRDIDIAKMAKRAKTGKMGYLAISG